MRRWLLLALEALAVPTLLLVVGIAVAPGRAPLIVHVYVVVVGGAFLFTLAVRLARSLHARGPSPFELGLVPLDEPAARIQQLEQLEREVTLGVQSAWDLHARLAPTLRQTASALLSTRRRIDLEREPARAADALGPEVWELVRPDRSPPDDRHQPGVDLARLDRTLDALERL
jgi:hypothetical protein